MPIAPLEGPALSLVMPHEPFDGAKPVPDRAASVGASAFGDLLQGVVESANTRGVEASHVASEFAAGRRDDIHGTMLALSKADIELRVVGNVRNKIVDAFYELWRMQV